MPLGEQSKCVAKQLSMDRMKPEAAHQVRGKMAPEAFQIPGAAPPTTDPECQSLWEGNMSKERCRVWTLEPAGQGHPKSLLSAFQCRPPKPLQPVSSGPREGTSHKPWWCPCAADSAALQERQGHDFAHWVSHRMSQAAWGPSGDISRPEPWQRAHTRAIRDTALGIRPPLRPQNWRASVGELKARDSNLRELCEG